MASGTLPEKLKLKPGLRAAVINAPDSYLKELGASWAHLDQTFSGDYDWIQVFVRNKAELDLLISTVKAALRPISLLWITFPKGSSKVQTDLTRDTGWDSIQDMKWVTLVSINDTWSAFSLRPYKPGEARQSFR